MVSYRVHISPRSRYPLAFNVDQKDRYLVSNETLIIIKFIIEWQLFLSIKIRAFQRK